MSVRVNEVEIAEDAILAEMQYHAAESAEEARHRAAVALVVREVLRQEAMRVGIEVPAGADPALSDDAEIEALIARDVALPVADEAACRRYYDSNRRRFRTPDRFLADHILVAVPPGDEEGRDAAKARATGWISRIAAEPAAMAELAGRFSDCPSKSQGGSLGWIERGQTVSEFETYLFSLEPGEVCGLPVESRYGIHVIRLNERRSGTDLPFAAVKDRIAGYLGESVKRRALHQYVSVLLGRADVGGIELGELSATPLVQ